MASKGSPSSKVAVKAGTASLADRPSSANVLAAQNWFGQEDRSGNNGVPSELPADVFFWAGIGYTARRERK
jgi:hypothetical protein